jgi:PncC family amidohydrolase
MIDAESPADLAGRLQAACLERRLAFETAESCTGGLIAKSISDLPGASGYFLGGVVSYSNEVKVAMLSVPPEQLLAHGAVSAQVARAMAVGARSRIGADVAVAVTGVAGPGGGSADKPVGLVYVAVADASGEEVRRIQCHGDRAEVRESATRVALELALARIESLP